MRSLHFSWVLFVCRSRQKHTRILKKRSAMSLRVCHLHLPHWVHLVIRMHIVAHVYQSLLSPTPTPSPHTGTPAKLVPAMCVLWRLPWQAIAQGRLAEMWAHDVSP